MDNMNSNKSCLIVLLHLYSLTNKCENVLVSALSKWSKLTYLSPWIVDTCTYLYHFFTIQKSSRKFCTMYLLLLKMTALVKANNWYVIYFVFIFCLYFYYYYVDSIDILRLRYFTRILKTCSLLYFYKSWIIDLYVNLFSP